MNRIDCNIIQDLLPSYIEGLTSTETNNEINEHLCECRKCSEILAEMAYGEAVQNESSQKEINFLKKVNRKSRTAILILLSVLVFSLAAAFACYGIFGISTEGYSADCINIANNILSADISLDYSGYGITKVTAEELDGVVTINVRSTAPIFKKDSTYELRYIVHGEITKVQTSNGQVLWENGEDIPKKINDIYNAKVKYIGDNSGVSNLLRAIDLNSTLRCESYSIHLITDKKPYGLEIYDINSYKDMFSNFTNESYEQSIKGCAYLILACIENLDFVEFDYIAPNGVEKTYKLTVDEANEFMEICNPASDSGVDNRSSVKDWSNSYLGLKILTFCVDSQLSTEQDLRFVPYFEGTSKETIELLSKTPIDRKYNYILNNEISDLISECENYYNWGEAYEKQYKIIYNSLLDYAKNHSDVEEYIREDLIKDIEGVQDYYRYNDKMASLYYTVDEIASGADYRGYINSTRYFKEARQKTLRLAECAYLLGVEFEWLE